MPDTSQKRFGIFSSFMGSLNSRMIKEIKYLCMEELYSMRDDVLANAKAFAESNVLLASQRLHREMSVEVGKIRNEATNFIKDVSRQEAILLSDSLEKRISSLEKLSSSLEAKISTIESIVSGKVHD